MYGLSHVFTIVTFILIVITLFILFRTAKIDGIDLPDLRVDDDTISSVIDRVRDHAYTGRSDDGTVESQIIQVLDQHSGTNFIHISGNTAVMSDGQQVQVPYIAINEGMTVDYDTDNDLLCMSGDVILQGHVIHIDKKRRYIRSSYHQDINNLWVS